MPAPVPAPRGPSWSQPWRDIASPELTAALEGIGALRRLADGQLLYQRGDMGSELYGVTAGLVVATVPASAEADERVAGLYGAGTWFGEITLFDDLPRPVSVHAHGPAEVLVVPAARLRALLDDHPIWYRDFARVLCNKLRLAMLHIEGASLPISVRLALRLLDLARTFGAPGGADRELVIDVKLSQETLARTLGLTRQSVNKELLGLEEHGWVRVRRASIAVVDAEGLFRHIREHGGAAVLAGLGELLAGPGASAR